MPVLMWKCPNCGKESDFNHIKCWNCDTPRPADQTFESTKREAGYTATESVRSIQTSSFVATDHRRSGQVQYDSKIIFEYANRLYARASFIIAVFTIIGGLIGLILGLIAGAALGGKEASLPVGIALGFVFAMLGYFIGAEIAFWIQLQAQVVLCQVQIEENTKQDLSEIKKISIILSETLGTITTSVSKITMR